MLEQLEKKIVEVVEEVLPSVVSVSTTTLARVNLFSVAPIQGQGSGVIIDKNGIIVTNAHVVRGAKKLEVQLHDGRSFNARVMGTVRGQDIAFLKIKSDDLRPITIGDSSSLKVGQFAIAVGNALGLGETVTFDF
jgi:S1-C subfamily serine protease